MKTRAGDFEPAQLALPDQTTLSRLAIGLTLGLIPVHLWLASRLELTFDEAYYRLWAQNLAWGYLDHPPMVAFWIRASTAIFGDGQLGVRAFNAFATAAGSYLIYRTTLLLLRDRVTALIAVLLSTASPLLQVGAIIVTPDTPLVFFWTLSLFGMAQLYRTDDAWWWLPIGIAAGLALTAKYSAAFLGAGIVSALLVVPALRRWLWHPAPYLAGLLAVVLFSPVVIWNAGHEWASFVKQLGRAVPHAYSWRYIGEFVGAQAGLMTPFVFVLAIAGLWRALRGVFVPRPDDAGDTEALRLLAAMVCPMLVYFLMHSLHDRVQGNWPAPLYPALAILAADAVRHAGEGPESGPRRRWQRLIGQSARLALPVGLAMTAMIYLQALTAVVPIPAGRDPTAQMTGWRGLADDIARLAQRQQAAFVLTSGYALTSELAVYGPSGLTVLQFNERLRWEAFKQPDEAIFAKIGLYVVEPGKDRSGELRTRFASVTPAGRVKRTRKGAIAGCYVVYVVGTPVAKVLEPLPAGAAPATVAPPPASPGPSTQVPDCGGREFDE